MRVNEIFSAIQGEGLEAGNPTIFLRVSGCNLNCKWCDTKYHVEGDEMELIRVEEKVLEQSDIIKHITVTGGEPTLQDEEIKLLMEEYIHGYKWSVETNGTIFTNCNYNIITISPKKQNVNIEVLSKYAKMDNTYFKFVYESKDELWWEKVIEKCNIPKDRVFIMPEGATRIEQLKKMPEVMEYCLEKGFKFGARLHVIAYDDKRGV